VIEMFQQNQQMLAQLRAQLFEEKTVDFILELVKSTTKEVDRDTLFADDPA
jgi:trigger factor